MTNYVLGFAFSRNRQNVVLIEKQKPDWQKGYLNGVGGKVEQFDETPTHAMVREFEEETGVLTAPTEWDHFATMVQRGCNIYCYRAFMDGLCMCETVTQEEIIPIAVRDLLSWPIIPNLKHLIPIALDLNIKFSEIQLS